MYVPETLEPGQQVTVICVFDLDFQQCQAPTFSWMGVALSSHQISLTTAHTSVLTFTPSSKDHDTSLTCRVDFPREHASFENSVRINVACEFGGDISVGSWSSGWGGRVVSGSG